MLIFLYGEDNFRSRQKLNELVEKYRQTNQESVNYTSLDFDVDDAEEIKKHADSQSLFKEKKFIVCKNALKNKEKKEYLLDFLKKNDFKNDDTVLLFYEYFKPDGKDNFFKFLKENASYQEFKKLEGNFLNKWIKSEIEKRGGECDFSVCVKLNEIFNGSMWRISNEIDKLISYNKKITLENIDLLCKKSISLNIFNLLDGIGAKNRKKSFEVLESYLNEGESEVYILSMILSQFRNMAKSLSLNTAGNSESQIAKITGLHPYAVKKSLQKAKIFGGNEILNTYKKIKETDISLKTGKQEPKLALSLLVLDSINIQ